MKNSIDISQITITNDPTILNEKWGITDDLLPITEKLREETLDPNNKKIVEKLLFYIEKYPKVAPLKNFLSIAYNSQGKIELAQQCNDWILAEHPDYLIARLNKVHTLIAKKEYEKIPEILGERLSLFPLFPERKVFHETEIGGYYYLVIKYCCITNNLALAEENLAFLKGLMPHNQQIELSEMLVQEFKDSLLDVHDPGVPDFFHVEILSLYQYGFDIPESILNSILALPRESLIKDLELVLFDAVNRFDYFESIEEEKSNDYFYIHALMLLGELKSYSSLPAILSSLMMDDEAIDFYLGDFVTEALWILFYHLAPSNFDLIKSAFLSEEYDTYVRLSFLTGLTQISLHQPEKRAEIENIFAELVSTLLKDAKENDKYNDTINSFFIDECLDANFTRFLPEIKALYKLDVVDESAIGSYTDVLDEMNSSSRYSPKREISTITNTYQRLNKLFGDSNSLFDDSTIPNEYLNEISKTPIERSEPKIGRNDPCPCGSGKKYKKCHGSAEG